MTRLAYASLVVLCTFAFAQPAFAYSNPGNPTGYVNDFAGVLSAQTKILLESELTAFTASTSNEIAVAIIPTLGDDYIENFATRLFKDWGVGSKTSDNGVLLLVAVAEHKLRIEVGYGLEGALPDLVAQSIINNTIAPRLKENDYDAAILSGVRDIEAATQFEYIGSSVNETPRSSTSPRAIEAFILFGLFAMQWLAAIFARSKSWWAGGLVGAIAGFAAATYFGFAGSSAMLSLFGLGGLGLLFDYIVSSAYRGATRNGSSIPWYAGGGSGGSSGGFGGFGGGRSGGGGASGGW